MVNIFPFKEGTNTSRHSRCRSIVFVIKAEKGKGLGHCFRAWTIANALPEHIDKTFILTPNSCLGMDFFKQKNSSNYRETDSQDTLLKELINLQPDLIINDILNTSAEYMKSLKQINVPIVNFEDIGLGSLYADCVINSVYSGTGNKNEYSGRDYVDIRNAFFESKKSNNRETKKEVRDILISFGGEDPTNLTLKTLNIIKNNMNLLNFHYFVALGPSYQFPNEIIHFISGSNINANVIINQDIAPLMANVDMAITANCRTVFEAAFMRLPTVVISANARECLHTFYREAGFPYCGNGQLVDDAIIETSILSLAYDTQRRKGIINALNNMDLTQGMSRIINIILTHLDVPNEYHNHQPHQHKEVS